MKLADACKVARKAKKPSYTCVVAPPRSPVKHAPLQVANELSLLGLPSEIKRMIWTEYFKLLADPNDDCVYVEQLPWKYRELPPHTIWFTRWEYGALPGYLEVLLVSREIYREALEVFWLTTNFSFYSHDQLARFLDLRMKVFSRRPRRYPTQLIRRMRLEISRSSLDNRWGDPLSVLQCLWAIACCTSPTLKLEIRDGQLQHLYNSLSAETIASLSEILDRLRKYQAEYAAAGLDLRVSKKQMETWLVAGEEFSVKLPPIPQKFAAKKRKTAAKRHWTHKKKISTK